MSWPRAQQIADNREDISKIEYCKMVATNIYDTQNMDKV